MKTLFVLPGRPGYPGNVRYVQYDPFLVQWLSKFWCSSGADPSVQRVRWSASPPPPPVRWLEGGGGKVTLTHRSWTPGGLHLSSISGLGQPEVTQVHWWSVRTNLVMVLTPPLCRAGPLLSFAISHLSQLHLKPRLSSVNTWVSTVAVGLAVVKMINIW